MLPVERVHEAELHLLDLLGRRAAAQIRDGLRSRNHPGALVVGGQEVVGEDLRPRVRQLGRDHDERRQVLVEGPQAVADPGAEARPREGDRTRVEAEGRLEVVGVVRVHRADEANVVHDAADVREEVAYHRAALAARLEIEERAKQVLDALRMRPQGRRLSVKREQLGLGIEGLQMGEAAGQEDEDHPLGLRRVVARLGRQGVSARVVRQQPSQDSREHQGAAHEGADRVATGTPAVRQVHRISRCK